MNDTIVIYLRLLGTAAVNVVLCYILHLIRKKTHFSRLPQWVQQTVIGVIFGASAVFGTECGTDIGTAVVNARDAAPLCAGLLFGGPAGIIAGFIGGIERWFSVYWGGGMYSRLACSLATCISGIYAALLRRYMFDKRRPPISLAFMTAVVMEVLHMSILFITHLSDAAGAYAIVRVTTVPMALCNAISVAASTFLLKLVTTGFHPNSGLPGSISDKVQNRMLICVFAAYLVTTSFVFILQTNTARSDAEDLILLNLEDVAAEIADSADEQLLGAAHSVKAALDENPNADLQRLADTYHVTDVCLVGRDGIIYASNAENTVGFDMHSSDQSRSFLKLLWGADEYVQDFQQLSVDTNGVSLLRKYAGCPLLEGGFVQVGYDMDTFRAAFSQVVTGITRNRHLGETGYILIANDEGEIVSDQGSHKSKTLTEAGILILSDTPQNTDLRGDVNGEDCLWVYNMSQGYYIVAVYPTAEIYSARDGAVYINSYMEVLVFAALFIFMYLMVKDQVVTRIRTVNTKLRQITRGDLSVSVEVHSSSEFYALSEDINTTVTTLKSYIAEAAARIDQELLAAKNIQRSALPSRFPAFPELKNIDIYATMDPAKEVGGDFYDLYRLGSDKVAFLIADVSGKGIPAAMFMMQAKTLIKNMAEEGHPVNDIFTLANEKLCEGNDAGMFVTAWMGILDLSTGRVTYANAGHNPPVVYREGQGFEYLRSRPGMVLAGMEGMRYKLQEVQLNPGDRIYLYTDGVTEATRKDLTLYGEERLLNFLNANPGASAKATLLSVKEDIDTFVGDAEQFDDITMVMLDYFGNTQTNQNL